MRRRNTIPLGRILGIPVGVDYSWFLIFVLLTWMLAMNYFPHEFGNWSAFEYWGVAAVTTIMLFVSVLLHELGHSTVAMRYDIEVRSITLFIFGGLAEIKKEPPKASAEFWIAIAGPIVSFLLAGIFFLIERATGTLPALWAITKYLALINFILAVFNLVPGFPLDGGRILRAAIWGVTKSFDKATRYAAVVGRFFGFFFIFLGVLQIFGGNLWNGLWIAFIGWFLDNAAAGQLQQQAVHEMLAGHFVRESMSRDFVIVPSDTTIQNVIDDHILGAGRRSLLIRENDKIIGMITMHRIKEVSIDKRPFTKVTDIMIPYEELKKVDPGQQLWAALSEMDKDGVNQLPVVENDEIIGVLSRESILTYLSTLTELGGR